MENECERCGEPLDSKKAVGLELNSKTGLYCVAGTVPEQDSQGLFYFGAACAKKVLANGGLQTGTTRGRTRRLTPNQKG